MISATFPRGRQLLLHCPTPSCTTATFSRTLRRTPAYYLRAHNTRTEAPPSAIALEGSKHSCTTSELMLFCRDCKQRRLRNFIVAFCSLDRTTRAAGIRNFVRLFGPGLAQHSTCSHEVKESYLRRYLKIQSARFPGTVTFISVDEQERYKYALPLRILGRTNLTA